MASWAGSRPRLKERSPISPVSVPVFNMLSTPVLDSVSLLALLGAAVEPPERTEAAMLPVMAETLLALLLRPLTLETGSEKGIVPPFGACEEASDESQED